MAQFGASDEVLGSIEDGLDFEKSIAAILERCRTADEISAAFNELERQYEAEISQEMRSTRARVFDNLDPNVQDKLKSYDTQQDVVLNRFEQLLLRVTRRQLDSFAEFDSDGHNFTLTHAPAEGIPTGKYFFKSKPQRGAHQYRYSSDLGQFVVQTALVEEAPAADLVFSIAASDRVAASTRELVGEQGLLTAELLSFTMRSGNDTVTESYVLAAGRADSGTTLDSEQVEQLLDLTCVEVSDRGRIDTTLLQPALTQQSKQFNDEVQNRTSQFSIEQGDLVESRLKDHKAKYDAEVRKLNKKEDDARARERRTDDLSERLKLRKEAQRLARRAEALYDGFKVERDALRQKADDYLEMIEQALKGTDEREHIFTVRWTVLE